MRIAILLIIVIILCSCSKSAASHPVWQSERDVLAYTLYAEARGEGEEGLKAVASVIHNRQKSRKLSLKAICLQKNQFDVWNRPRVTIKEQKAWIYCQKLASSMMAGTFKPIHPYVNYYAYKQCKPDWGNFKKYIIIKNHIFGNA